MELTGPAGGAAASHSAAVGAARTRGPTQAPEAQASASQESLLCAALAPWPLTEEAQAWSSGGPCGPWAEVSERTEEL